MRALDALGISKMMKQNVVIDASTPLYNKHVKVIFNKNKISKISSVKSVIWWSDDEGTFAKVRCGEINFFTSMVKLKR